MLYVLICCSLHAACCVMFHVCCSLNCMVIDAWLMLFVVGVFLYCANCDMTVMVSDCWLLLVFNSTLSVDLYDVLPDCCCAWRNVRRVVVVCCVLFVCVLFVMPLLLSTMAVCVWVLCVVCSSLFVFAMFLDD